MHVACTITAILDFKCGVFYLGIKSVANDCVCRVWAMLRVNGRVFKCVDPVYVYKSMCVLMCLVYKSL